MSWFKNIASNLEDALNKVDQSAADAFQKESNGRNPQPPSISPQTYTSSSATYQDRKTGTVPQSSTVPSNLGTSYGVSKPISNTSTSNANTSRDQGPRVTSDTLQKSASSSKIKKDTDDELFKFLNSSDPAENKRKTSNYQGSPKPSSAKHSRASSISSTTSNKSSKSTAGLSSVSSEKPGATESDSGEGSANEHQDELPSNNAESSGYHSNHEETSHSQQLSSLELENRLLKNEISSLNQEMASVINRAKTAQDELIKTKAKLDSYNVNISQHDQIIRELRSKENDHQEALQAKDSQLAVLRVRWEEADKELTQKRQRLEQLENDRERILQDHSSVSGVQSQALESVKEKLHEAEMSLKREQEAYKAAQHESAERQSKLEAEQQSLATTLKEAQKKMNEDKGKAHELAIQLKSAKTNLDVARQELTEYKDKAARILQSKDKLISTLKEGGSGAFADGGASVVELEETKQERDLLREELQQSKMTVEHMRAELQDLEHQLQSDSDAAQEQLRLVEEELSSEKRRREEAEQEILKQKQELQYVHEEMYKQKTMLQKRLTDREGDIDKLRNQLTTKSLSSSNESELENRLHALTESLIQKQTMLEALSTEKNSLALQLERAEQQYKEAQSAAIRAMSTNVPMHDDDEVRQRVPGFMRETPQDTNMVRRVKQTANTIDKFSVRLGIFLRRYPMARIFVIVYMLILHLWVMIVLLTYQPEMHDASYHTGQVPQPPGAAQIPHGPGPQAP